METCLMETWLKSFHHTKWIFLDGYRHLININRNKEGLELQFLLKILNKWKLIAPVI